MLTIVAVVHIIACLLLIALVLLQDPKATGGSTMFGGTGSSNVIGATGGASLLQKMTRYAAIVFGVCCLLLTMLSRRDAGSGSVFDNLNSATPTAPISAPATPGTSAPAAPGTSAPANAPAAPATAPVAPAPGSQTK